ncbi:hypothetical protein [Vulgatibacter incomptus]|uniref:Uncharacterized protein n=1 Tax=Vulgatibacter incomptus TaxID=1391653 RepID=A0A0K1PBQ1_9BACT|nr:hypothetical protein [Vulgatibacter incomptus]AKU90831.1 hypothetical protein AKJ08_1218 [Vulgatibacter incomptus]
MTKTTSAAENASPNEAAELLRALWAKHLVVTRAALSQAIGKLHVEQARSGTKVTADSPIFSTAIHRHLETLVRTVVAEFKAEAVPEPATSQFLASEAVTLLEGLIERAVIGSYAYLDRLPGYFETRDRSESTMVVVLEQVASTEIRAIKASAKFVRPVATEQLSANVGSSVIITGDQNRVITGDGNYVRVTKIDPNAEGGAGWPLWLKLAGAVLGFLAAAVSAVTALAN